MEATHDSDEVCPSIHGLCSTAHPADNRQSRQKGLPSFTASSNPRSRVFDNPSEIRLGSGKA
eukprot:4895474-Pleurochrysis_carterae.AAC.1